MIQIGHYLALSIFLFSIGAAGFFIRRNVLIQLMCIELMFNSVNLALIGINRFFPDNHFGQTFSLFIIVIAAAEAAIGLTIATVMYRRKKTLAVDQMNALKH